jgi:uncharacterized protein YbjQ (UPF0145 family)
VTSKLRLGKSVLAAPIGHPCGTLPPPYRQEALAMELTTLENVPGKTITRHIGLVQGSTVRAKHVGRDILAGLKNIVGGELKSYTMLLNESRNEALDRMVEQARAAGANAVLNIRFSTSNIAAGAAEVMAYGTAAVVS